MVFKFALIPVAVLFFWMLFNDRENPEPFWQIIKALLVGVAIAFPVVFIEIYLSQINPFAVGGVQYAAYDTYIVAGLTEETFKLLGVLLFFVASRHFNEKMDGIVYCALVSLGFAAIENVLYLANALNMQELYSMAVMRGIFSVPAHCIFAVIMGFFLSKSVYAKTFGGQAIFLFLAWGSAVLAHGTYNFIITILHENAMLVLAGFMLILFILALVCIRAYRKEAKRQFGKMH